MFYLSIKLVLLNAVKISSEIVFIISFGLKPTDNFLSREELFSFQTPKVASIVLAYLINSGCEKITCLISSCFILSILYPFLLPSTKSEVLSVGYTFQ